MRVSIQSFWRRLALAFSIAAGFAATAAFGGEINDIDGAAIKGYDPVAYYTVHKPVEGSAQFTSVYKGATFRFASAANRDAFAAAPEKFAPQYGGFCAYGAAGGYKAAIDPAAWSIVDGKLYLNYNKRVQTSWNQDQSGYIAKADKNWPGVAAQDKVNR